MLTIKILLGKEKIDENTARHTKDNE